MRSLVFVAFSIASIGAKAQFTASVPIQYEHVTVPDYYFHAIPYKAAPKLYQRNIGIVAGLQKGKYTLIELGGEAHWRKISLLKKPYIIGATTNMEYNFSENVLGYKAGMWMKRGRINFTYGANVGYYTNFEGSRFSIGPAIGFRLLGFHLTNGINILTKDNTSDKANPIAVNPIYLSLKYYFPVQNKFVWDKETRKKKEQKRKEREQKKKLKEKEKANNEQKGIRGLFKRSGSNSTDTKNTQPKPEEKKGLKKLFQKKIDE